MRVLVACEESQAVCKAFRSRGHEAYSCDIQDCSGGHPEWHIKGDVLPLLRESWDLIIAHPPCTYLSNAGANHLYPKAGQLNEERYRLGLKAKDFFMQFYLANCSRICVENPIASSVFQLPKYDQIIQPFQFGHPFKKTTCLWLKGLPKLQTTDLITEGVTSWVSAKGTHVSGKSKRNPKLRSKTFEGIASAMAEQWGIW